MPLKHLPELTEDLAVFVVRLPVQRLTLLSSDGDHILVTKQRSSFVKKSRIIAVLAGAAAISLSLAACSSGSNSSSTSGGKQTLTIEDYYTADPGMSGYNNMYKQCGD